MALYINYQQATADYLPKQLHLHLWHYSSCARCSFSSILIDHIQCVAFSYCILSVLRISTYQCLFFPCTELFFIVLFPQVDDGLVAATYKRTSGALFFVNPAPCPVPGNFVSSAASMAHLKTVFDLRQVGCDQHGQRESRGSLCDAQRFKIEYSQFMYTAKSRYDSIN